MDRKKRILIIGPSTKNIGGVSTHLKRLCGILDGSADIDFIDEGRRRWPGVFNIRSLNLVEYFRKLHKADTIYVNSGAFPLRAFHIIAGRVMNKNIITTIHFNPLERGLPKLNRLLVRLSDHVIAVNEEGYRFLSSKSGKTTYHQKPAFLPPDIELEPELPDEIINIIDKAKNQGAKLIVSNAFRLRSTPGGELYGLDTCIEACRIMKSQGYNISFIFIVPAPDECAGLFNSFKAKISEYNLADTLFLIGRPVSFVRLLEKADVYVRPTRTDGDAISIREALALGKAVVASDVAKRPEGVITYPSDDINAFIKAIHTAEKPGSNVSGTTDTVDFYKNLLLMNRH